MVSRRSGMFILRTDTRAATPPPREFTADRGSRISGIAYRCRGYDRHRYAMPAKRSS